MTNIAIMGHGVVGSGVMEVILTHKESLETRANDEINVKYILDLREFPELPYADKFTKSFDDIINDDEVKIVVEVMGGITPAYDYVKACLEHGKNVVTSNKELVASKGAELLRIAKEKNLNFLFEASVGGGIPIIRPISQCLAANDVAEISGILNGTTNFILTKMIREKMSFDDALALAQENGYAERDPSADVDGDDASRKICILASLAFGNHVYPDEVHTEGIREITLDDVSYAKAWGGVIKLIGTVKMLKNEKINIFVAPMFVSEESQLAHVDDVFNGIMVRGDATGDVVFYGKGAGKLPTASAVVADIIDCIKHFASRKYLFWEDAKENYVENILDIPMDFFLRVEVDDKEDAESFMKTTFKKTRRIVSETENGSKEMGFVVYGVSLDEIKKSMILMEENGIRVKNRIIVSDL